MLLTLQKLLQKAKQISDPRDAHALALDLVESMLRHYAVVAIAAYRHSGARDPKINRILSEQLPRPSMGSWKNFLQMLAHADPHLFPEQFWDKFLQPLTKKISNPDISAAYSGLRKLADQDVFSPHDDTSQAESAQCTPLEFFDGTVTYRNRFAGHGTHELPDSALKFAPIFLKGMVALYNHLNTLWLAFPVYLAKQAKLYGRTYFRLTPLVEAEGIGELQAAAHEMEEDRLYICFGDRKHPEVESLYPAALWEEGDILFANGTKGLIDIHYIGYTSQQSFETSIYQEDFQAFIGPFELPRETEAAKTSAIPKTTYTESAPQSFTKEVPSIAVLPFINISADPEQEYFCDGITEEIINALSHVEALKVIARTSAFAFKGKQEDIREIGKKLDVENLLEGSIRKAGNRLRITAQLVKVADGSHLWSEKFDREMEDIFAIQDEISLAIVRELKVRLLKEEETAVVKRYTADTEAYEFYLKGRYFLSKRHEEGLKKGSEYFQQAIEKDPSYAIAFAGIAECYFYLGLYNFMAHQDAYPRMKWATDKALELDNRLAEAHAMLGGYKQDYEWDFPGSEKEFKYAIELNPNSDTAHYFFANLLYIIPGKFDEGITEIRRSCELDPLSTVYITGMGLALTFMRRYNEAFHYYQKALELDPHRFSTQLYLGLNYCGEENWDKAIAVLNTARTVSEGSPPSLGYLGYAYAKAGQNENALRVIAELSDKPEVSSYYKALVYIGLDDKESAFVHLGKALAEHEPNLVWFKLYPWVDNLRDDPRFHALVKKIGLPE
jgi:adenylate cyclase